MDQGPPHILIHIENSMTSSGATLLRTTRANNMIVRLWGDPLEGWQSLSSSLRDETHDSIGVSLLGKYWRHTA